MVLVSGPKSNTETVNSLSMGIKARNHAAINPGLTRGTTISLKVLPQPAPEILAASSNHTWICSRDAPTDLTANAIYLAVYAINRIQMVL